MNPLIAAITLLLATLFAGCAGYQGMTLLPLNPAETAGKLTLPRGKSLVIEAGQIEHPILRPIKLNADDGLSPEEAAVLAVILNPTLRAARDQYGEAQAQLLQAGILPNPQLGSNIDFVVGGATLGTQTAYAAGLSWDVRSLLVRKPKVASAKAAVAAVHLDVAWLEWQTALEAKASAYDLISLQSQIASAKEISDRLQENAELLDKATAEGEKTVLDAAAAESAANNATSILLGLKQQERQARIALNRAIGYPAQTEIRIQDSGKVGSRFTPPSREKLYDKLEDRRLDLIALRRGYESQDAKLRTAILSQFPAINLGFNNATDTGNVKTAGPGLTIDLPLFDRNQGGIAMEKATRQRLFDEYTARVFQARSDIASALVDIHSLNDQIAHAEQALPTLRKVVEVSREAVGQGNADVLAYYSAENDLTQRSIGIFSLKQQLARARVALEIAAAWPLTP